MYLYSILHYKKWLAILPSPAGMSLKELYMAGNIISRQGERISAILAADGKISNLFHSV